MMGCSGSIAFLNISGNCSSRHISATQNRTYKYEHLSEAIYCLFLSSAPNSATLPLFWTVGQCKNEWNCSDQYRPFCFFCFSLYHSFYLVIYFGFNLISLRRQDCLLSFKQFWCLYFACVFFGIIFQFLFDVTVENIKI